MIQTLGCWGLGALFVVFLLYFLFTFSWRTPQVIEGYLVMTVIGQTLSVVADERMETWLLTNFKVDLPQRQALEEIKNANRNASSPARVRVRYVRNIFGSEVHAHVEILTLGYIFEPK